MSDFCGYFTVASGVLATWLAYAPNVVEEGAGLYLRDAILTGNVEGVPPIRPGISGKGSDTINPSNVLYSSNGKRDESIFLEPHYDISVRVCFQILTFRESMLHKIYTW
jgi:hypothetical protein